MTDRGPDARRGFNTQSSSEPKQARQGVLDRQLIVRVAVDLIDERGLRELTMRALGLRLGVEAMTLYHYFSGKEALLDAIVESVIDQLYGDPHVRLDSPDGWQDYLQRLAHGFRRMALSHPAVFPLIATRPPAAPWVRPPLRSLRWMESFLDTMLAWGFTDADAVVAYRAFSSFLLGHLLLEVSAHGVDTGPVEETDPAEHPATSTNLSSYPQLARLQPALSEDHSLDEFVQALESLLDRLAATLRR